MGTRREIPRRYAPRNDDGSSMFLLSKSQPPIGFVRLLAQEFHLVRPWDDAGISSARDEFLHGVFTFFAVAKSPFVDVHADELADQFVGMYVNKWTLGYGEKGKHAVHELITRGTNSGIIAGPPLGFRLLPAAD